MKKSVKGITLIALVVTIIVLLILAGIAINLTIGNNGLFSRAQNAANTWREAEANEAQEMKNFESLYDETLKELGMNGEKETISKSEKYVGYYADIEGDGKVDGIIYADLAVGGNGQWGNSDGIYTIPVVGETKEYYISQKNYEGPYGTKDVISPTGSGNERFYIMALKDIDGKVNETTYTWYSEAYGEEDNYKTEEIFGEGKSNTTKMIEYLNNKTYGEENTDSSYKDIWGEIQEEVKKGWFVPSKEEWSAFGGELEITKDNYQEYELSVGYWSSSQNNTSRAWVANLSDGYMAGRTMINYGDGRLSTTF